MKESWLTAVGKRLDDLPRSPLGSRICGDVTVLNPALVREFVDHIRLFACMSLVRFQVFQYDCIRSRPYL
ncbi:MAG: hypothetical protein ACI97A_002368 [Planctomycetota bacterium]|jgi:hypothetical protein